MTQPDLPALAAEAADAGQWPLQRFALVLAGLAGAVDLDTAVAFHPADRSRDDLRVTADGAAAGPDRQAAALSMLVTRPRLLVRLDELVRTVTPEAPVVRRPPQTLIGRYIRYIVEGSDPPAGPSDTIAGPALRELLRRAPETAGPIGLALLSSHRDGHVRERAVRIMAERGVPEHLPFLVLRCGDWVKQVREPARAAFLGLLRDRPERVVPAALPAATHIDARDRAGDLAGLLTAALEQHFDLVAPVLLRSRDARSRRLAFTTGLRDARWSAAELVGFASRDRDTAVRARAAEAAISQAVGHRDVVTLRSLAASRFSGVRAGAFAALSGLGHDTEVAAALDDPSPLVRALARSRAADPAGHYRAVVAGRPAPGAVAGLGETGGHADAGLLTPLLTHPDRRIRAAAVRALVTLDAVPVKEVTALLTDPAAAVVREASLALRPYRRRVSPALLWQLMADPRPEVRLGAYRLLAVRGPAQRMAAALTLAGEPEWSLARRGRLETLRLADTLHRVWPSDLDAAPGEVPAGLWSLAERARPRLADRWHHVDHALGRFPVSIAGARRSSPDDLT